ncbi:inositol-3-phosphate synthase [bacterium]|nr:inositol-3-phosphate synthase [bacterium]
MQQNELQKIKDKKTGVWLIGAYGGISVCVIAGAMALRAKKCSANGLVTELDIFKKIPLLPWDNLVFGGMDIRKYSIVDTLKELHTNASVLSHDMITDYNWQISEVEKNIYPGIIVNCGKAITETSDKSFVKDGHLSSLVAYIQDTLEQFKKNNSLDDIIVVNISSTEPEFFIPEQYAAYEGMKSAFSSNSYEKYPASVVYAWAAIDAGYPYINFTPSQGANIAGIKQLAIERKIPYSGNDGKTGETLLKSVLAPMFLLRNLEVMSWEGYNILGNRDGLILNDPENKKTKIRSKANTLDKILGYKPHSKVSIDMVPSLNDWKIAWDFIHFKGFLDTPMTLQFMWQGCDSLLAAPLVLDLIRLLEFSHRHGEFGAQTQYSCFFKDPLECDEFDFRLQFFNLINYVSSKEN